MIEFFVVGKPVAQGSKIPVRRGHRVFVVDDNANELRRWRRRVALLANSEMRGRPLLDGEIQVRLVFYLYRPKSAKPDATPTAAKKPDSDKLERAIFDALTGVVWRDDAQVTDCWTRKRVAEHGKPMGVRIAVRPARSVEVSQDPADRVVR